MVFFLSKKGKSRQRVVLSDNEGDAADVSTNNLGADADSSAPEAQKKRGRKSTGGEQDSKVSPSWLQAEHKIQVYSAGKRCSRFRSSNFSPRRSSFPSGSCCGASISGGDAQPPAERFRTSEPRIYRFLEKIYANVRAYPARLLPPWLSLSFHYAAHVLASREGLQKCSSTNRPTPSQPSGSSSLSYLSKVAAD